MATEYVYHGGDGTTGAGWTTAWQNINDASLLNGNIIIIAKDHVDANSPYSADQIIAGPSSGEPVALVTADRATDEYTRASNTEYIEGVDLVIPSTPNGFMYECSSGGISASSEPTFTAQKGKTTADGTVKWKAAPYSLLLHTGDIIKAASSTWSGTNSETIDSEEIVDSIQTKFRLTAVASGATSATIVNHFTVTRANGDEEEFDRTLIIEVKEL